MKSKRGKILLIVVLTALLFVVFDCLTGKAGNLEPNAPPEPTMVTLGQISAQIEALSSPVKKVVRGVITIEKNETTGLDSLSSSVDPNCSVVLLSDAVASEHGNPDYPEWLARTGACLVGLTEGQITVRVEDHQAEQKVSYQIIEYK
jgi:hypothetical protein